MSAKRIFVFLSALFVSAIPLVGSPVIPAVAGGKPAKFWLSAAARDISTLKVENDQTFIPALNQIAQEQIVIGDRAGAIETITAMEKLVSAERGSADFDLMSLTSAEISAGRTAQARVAVDKMAKSPLSEPGQVPWMVIAPLGRLGEVDKAVNAALNSPAGLQRAARCEDLAWILYNTKHVADADKLLNAAIKELKSALNAGIASSKIGRILIARERYSEAMDWATDVPANQSWNDRAIDLLLVANDSKKPRAVATFADLIVGRLKQHPGNVIESLQIAESFARVGEVDRARTLVKDLAAVKLSKSDAWWFERTNALIDIWARDPAASVAVTKAAADSSGVDRANFFQAAAKAYAAVDDDVHALAMADKADLFRESALSDVIQSQGKMGHADLAIKEIEQLQAPFNLAATRYLGRGWALAKDSSGLQKWVDSIKDPNLKSQAEAGVAEGLINDTIHDPYDAPFGRSTFH